jgi:hypothetical protein
VGLVLALSTWVAWPTYLEIDLPVHPERVGYFWYTTTNATEMNADKPGELYIRRRHRSGLSSQFKTKEEALAWFSARLMERGWVPSSSSHFQPRPPVPELDFLNVDEHFTYYREGDFGGYENLKQGLGGQVTVAVWSEKDGSTNMLFVTAQPSLLRHLFEVLDD